MRSCSNGGLALRRPSGLPRGGLCRLAKRQARQNGLLCSGAPALDRSCQKGEQTIDLRDGGSERGARLLSAAGGVEDRAVLGAHAVGAKRVRRDAVVFVRASICVLSSFLKFFGRRSPWKVLQPVDTAWGSEEIDASTNRTGASTNKGGASTEVRIATPKPFAAASEKHDAPP